MQYNQWSSTVRFTYLQQFGDVSVLQTYIGTSGLWYTNNRLHGRGLTIISLRANVHYKLQYTRIIYV